MEDHENVEPSSAESDLSRELAVLKAERSNLLAQLDYETDPDARAEIDVHLMQNRMHIERIVGDFTGEIPTIRPTERSYVVATGEHPSVRAQYESSGFAANQGPRQQAPMANGPNGGALNGGRRPIRWRWVATGALVTLCLVGLAALSIRLSDSDEATGVVSDTSIASATVVDEISSVLAGMGHGDVVVTMEGETILLAGTVASEEARNSAIGAAEALASPKPVDATNLVVQQANPVDTSVESTPRADALQQDLNRTLASTPLIFQSSATDLTELHVRILNDVAASLLAYPDLTVRIVGFSDAVGDPETNRRVSLARAENVKAYLVQQGVPEGSLSTDARGEDDSSGSAQLGGLERRVELEVVGSGSAVAAPGTGALRVAIVAPSARNDLAFTQSMVDAVNVIAGERGDVEVAITDSTFVQDDAAAAIRSYADQGYDLVIAHGSQFGSSVLEIAPDYPEIAFAWGTASDTFGLPNVYAYDASSDQGGYVLGTMAAMLSGSGVVGVVGPIEVGDAELYVNGFSAGAAAQTPGLDVRVTYTDSFSDLALASETAQAHLEAGADVMTGSAQMVVGAVNVASENNVPWFGTQSNQTSLAPNLVVASQVYHWEVILRTIIADIESGNPTGASYTATLANGGLVIEYNPDYPLAPEVKERGDQVIADVSSGAVTTN